ncbi:MAG: hypothetical protein RIC15_06935 [Vicingaceae bacterium]
MKNPLIVLSFLSLIIFGCQQESDPELTPEQLAYQELQRESAIRDSAMLELMTTLNMIDENVSKISDRHNKIDMHANDVEFRKNYRDRMLDEIQEIYEMMESNKERINDLNARLADTRNKLGKSNKENERLIKLLDQYQLMINSLEQKIEGKDKEIYNLKEKLAKMDISLDSLKSEVQSKHAEMNTVYFAFGTKKELLYHKVIDKSGGFIGIGKTFQLKDDFDKSYFTQSNAEELKEIELFVKDAKLLSQHRKDSYHFEGEDAIDKLVIDDPNAFWEASKYLVIEVNQ